MKQLQIFSPAKINIHLSIVGRRPDGYHLLRMLMVPLDFGDDIVVTRINQTEPPVLPIEELGPTDQISIDNITLRSPATPFALDASHLCLRAAQAMRAYVATELSKPLLATEPLDIILYKRIPVGAGLGGGSSNAAAVLRALNFLWDLDLPSSELAKIGLPLGADIPFFCHGEPALVEGIGERITELREFPALPILLINPRIHVSTENVFRRSALQLTSSFRNASFRALFKGFSEVADVLSNDLELVTMELHPVVSEIKQTLIEKGAAALMTGSGPTVFGLFHTIEERDKAYELLNKSGWWIKRTSITGASPNR